MKKLLIWLNGANMADALITCYAISIFGRSIEANPYFNCTIQGMILGKIGNLLLLSGIMYWIFTKSKDNMKRKAMYYSMLITSVVLTCVVIWDLFILATL